MKRINSVRQLKKHLKPPFNRMFYSFVVTTYTDTFYDGRKGIFIDRSERYYIHNGVKSKIVNVSTRRRKTIADGFINETYILLNFPDRTIIRHG